MLQPGKQACILDNPPIRGSYWQEFRSRNAAQVLVDIVVRNLSSNKVHIASGAAKGSVTSLGSLATSDPGSSFGAPRIDS